jgi:hypothetical protein
MEVAHIRRAEAQCHADPTSSNIITPTSTVKRNITLIETEKCYKATVYFFIQPRTAPASRSFASGRSSESKNCDPELFLNEELLICIRLP